MGTKQKVLFIIFLVLAIATNVFILVEGGMSGSLSGAQSGGITNAFIEFVRRIDPNSPIVTDPDSTHYLVRKLVGHFGLFGISGIFTTLSFMLYKNLLREHRWLLLIISAFIGLLIAFTSELLQLLHKDRFFSPIDTLIDFAGYIGFGGITFLIGLLVIRKDKSQEA